VVPTDGRGGRLQLRQGRDGQRAARSNEATLSAAPRSPGFHVIELPMPWEYAVGGGGAGAHGRGLHSFTFQLNVNASCGMGGAFRGCLGSVRGCWGLTGGAWGVFSYQKWLKLS